MALDDKLLGSQTFVTGYRVAPYLVESGRPEYFQRVYIGMAVAPPVDPYQHETAIVGRNQAEIPKVQVGVNPVDYGTGAPKLRGNAAGVVGGAR